MNQSFSCFIALTIMQNDILEFSNLHYILPDMIIKILSETKKKAIK